MIVTRAQIEITLIRRHGKQMIFVGLDGITVNGTNGDLTAVIGSAILLLGGSVVDITVITDADITTIPEEFTPAIFDASELYLISTIRNQITSVDEVTGPFQAKLSQLPDRLLADWKSLKAKLLEDWGVGGPSLELGVILQDFAAHNEELNSADI
jgi:hypothetical protein